MRDGEPSSRGPSRKASTGAPAFTNQGSSSYHGDNQSLYFTLKDPKTQSILRVRYKGVKPGNFEDAISIVAIGRFDAGTKEFDANKLLVKCPSKYQGAEVNKQYS